VNTLKLNSFCQEVAKTRRYTKMNKLG